MRQSDKIGAVECCQPFSVLDLWREDLAVMILTVKTCTSEEKIVKSNFYLGPDSRRTFTNAIVRDSVRLTNEH